MSKINGVSGVFSVLRTHAAKLGKAKQTLDSEKTSISNATATLDPKSVGQVVRKSLETIDQTISIEDKIRRVIRSVLAWEFGDDILDDPKFYRLLDGVLDSINKSEALMSDFKSLFEEVGGPKAK